MTFAKRKPDNTIVDSIIVSNIQQNYNSKNQLFSQNLQNFFPSLNLGSMCYNLHILFIQILILGKHETYTKFLNYCAY
jgi:hypothetical protein